MTTDNVITTDQPLTASQQRTLAALLEVMLPASEDRVMPGAQELDLVAYISDQSENFLPRLIEGLGNFSADFADLAFSERYPLVQVFSETQAGLFDELLFHTYCCYYQDDRVLEGIGLSAGPPFPTGNTLEPGDLSLLDPVLERSKGYRR